MVLLRHGQALVFTNLLLSWLWSGVGIRYTLQSTVKKTAHIAENNNRITKK